MTRLLPAASVVCVVAVCGFAVAAYALARASERRDLHVAPHATR